MRTEYSKRAPPIFDKSLLNYGPFSDLTIAGRVPERGLITWITHDNLI
jgi:hypothetical protein